MSDLTVKLVHRIAMSNGTQHPNIHIQKLASCKILGISYKDVVVNLFIQTLVEAKVEWFHHLTTNSQIGKS